MTAPLLDEEMALVDAPATPVLDCLYLRRLQVRRAPGIEDAYTLDALSPGVTVIHGPNGSGKSTTARAIEAALWPEALSRAARSVRAEFDLSGMRVLVDVDGSQCAVQRDGAPWQLPTLPAPELKHRYRLSLHELLAEDDGTDFAKQVIRQSSGGLDLDAAARAIGTREKPSTCRDELKALDAAARRLKDAHQDAERVHREAASLTSLDARLQEARAARAAVRQLELARQHASARDSQAIASERLGNFPGALAGLRGDEFDRLCALRSAIRQCEVAVAERDREIATATATIATLCPGGPPAAADVGALREAVALLGRREEELARAQQREDEAIGARDRSRAILGPSVTDEQLAGIDASEVEALSDFGERAEQRRAERAALEAELRWVEGPEAPAGDAEQLRQGIGVLAQWLAEPGLAEAPPAPVFPLVGLLVIALGASALLVVRSGTIGYVAGALALLLFVLGRRAGERPSVTPMRPQRERDYADLRLTAPEAWEIDAVRRLLQELARRLGEHALQEQRRQRRDALRARARALEAQWQALDVERAELAARIGVPSTTPEPRLAWLLVRIGDWQEDEVGAVAARAACDACDRQHEAALADVRRCAVRCRMAVHSDLKTAAAWRGALMALETEVRECETAERNAAHARTRRDEEIARRDGHVADVARLLEAAGLGPDGDAQLDAWCAMHAEYVVARNALTACEGTLTTARRGCADVEDADEALLGLSVGAIEERLAIAEAEVGTLEALTAERTALAGTIARASTTEAVAEALAEREAATGALEATYAEDLDAALGHLLVQHVHAETRDRHRPEVFHVARSIFADVTRDRYRLELDADGERFRAVDTVLHTGHALDELSSATRVQLLLAVRLAFVEAQETSLRLPLLLDELLGTSDDVRAAAIVDAVIALARSGRQVLYFTAQSDEVARWAEALKAAGVDHACVDLAAVRARRADVAATVPRVRPALVGTVPAPEGRTHAEYGALLRVPPVDPLTDAVESTHLWYLVEDVGALHRLLTLGVERWGQLEQLEGRGGLGVIGVDPAVVAQARGLARALRVHHEEVRVGRARPVTAEVLDASGAVSARMRERVVRALKECDGDGEALLQRMEEGQISDWRVKQTDRLREYLQAGGFLSYGGGRSGEEVRLAMLAVLEGTDPSTAVAVDDLLDRLAHLATVIPLMNV